MKRTRKVKHEIPNGSELADLLPKGLKWRVVGDSLFVWAKRWPHEEGTRLIKFFAEHGIPNKWASGENL